jgi:hypothetical protein
MELAQDCVEWRAFVLTMSRPRVLLPESRLSDGAEYHRVCESLIKQVALVHLCFEALGPVDPACPSPWDVSPCRSHKGAST